MSNEEVVVKMADCLLMSGANCNAKSWVEGKTALHYALVTYGGNFRLIRKLIACGADCDALDSDWNTPLHFAARIHTFLYDAEDPFIILMENGANPDIANVKGLTADYIVRYSDGGWPTPARLRALRKYKSKWQRAVFKSEIYFSDGVWSELPRDILLRIVHYVK